MSALGSPRLTISEIPPERRATLPQPDKGRFADDPGMIGKGYADLRDLPLGGIRIGTIQKLACHSFGSRSRSLPAI